ncbi:DUF998 domain-containing protein [Nocardiopsis changdeensis]|uniref:DUF998 domain-containing protein n=1 Tax=Nocardiopsis changdeensis TaxID=2831969 RepID=A0ABX8BZ10_9ACTN|nr:MULTISPECIES: DUF998 domain-containing protein [Nocardiopsis]QUX25583.1 DUF998 domain-containing protein [Nocardiopsis changdeensis]QYX35969.1 DUF998 domain-containing protein [Nocardiopsis sp. MT53]
MSTVTAPAPGTSATAATRRLLAAGALAGPVFFTSAVAQILTREGFDITRHPISQLATGDLGWIQIATFATAGLGALALAAGTARTLTEGLGRRALPVLVAVFGVGLIAAGVFTMDPEYGFPVGTPDGPVEEMSWHSIAHSAAAAVAFTALAVAAAVLAVRHARRRAVAPAVLSGAAAAVLLLPMSPDHMSVQIAVNGLVAFTWATAVALWLRRTA